MILIQAYALFYLVFYKGGENSYFIFQLVFCLLLISTPLLYDKKCDWKMNIFLKFDIICLKGKILSIGKISIKMLICLLTIGIKILLTFNWYYWFISFNWYHWWQEFLYWLSFNWYHGSLILLCFNWYHVGRICFIVTPYWSFCFGQKKGGENCFTIYLDPFVDDWQKGGELFEFICMFLWLCMFLYWYQYWYQECLF